MLIIPITCGYLRRLQMNADGYTIYGIEVILAVLDTMPENSCGNFRGRKFRTNAAPVLRDWTLPGSLTVAGSRS